MPSPPFEQQSPHVLPVAGALGLMACMTAAFGMTAFHGALTYVWTLVAWGATWLIMFNSSAMFADGLAKWAGAATQRERGTGSALVLLAPHALLAALLWYAFPNVLGVVPLTKIVSIAAVLILSSAVASLSLVLKSAQALNIHAAFRKVNILRVILVGAAVLIAGGAFYTPQSNAALGIMWAAFMLSFGGYCRLLADIGRRKERRQSLYDYIQSE